MPTDTLIVRIENGMFAGIECSNPAIRHVAVVTDGFDERLTEVRQLVTEDEIAQAVHTIRGCRLMGAWHAVDSARDIVVAAERVSAEASAQLRDALHAPIADRPTDLGALLDNVAACAHLIEAAERHHERALEALRQFKVIVAEAHHIVGAADGGHHQTPLSTWGADDVRH